MSYKNIEDSEQVSRIAAKCIKIFARRIDKGHGDSQKTVYKFLERIFPDNWGVVVSIYDSHVRPIVRERFFNGMSVGDFVAKALTLYRDTHSLEQVWYWLDNEWPLDCDEYSCFVELAEVALASELRPPTKEDWEELNEWLLK